MIVNPGARRADRAERTALDAFSGAGIECDAVRTAAPGDAMRLARERASGVDAVFTLGGDGTAMEVVTALAGTGPPVGILPGGTGNVLVRSFGIPLNVTRAVQALVAGDEAHIDLGRLPDGRHFAIGLGVGLDEAMISGASRLWKRRAGVAAYVWSATKAVVQLERFHVRLTVDGTVYERDAASVLIANLGSVLGGLVRLGDDILHDDGLLHACVFMPRTVVESARIFAAMLRGTAHLDPRTFYVAGREFRLETDPPRRAQADGELLETTPLEISVRPRAAALLIPQPRGPRSSS